MSPASHEWQLAAAASVKPATASGHLAKLQEADLVVCEARGRHRYYRLADQDVAHALEALALVAERPTHARMWEHPARSRLRFARCCYGHLAGELGVSLLTAMLAHQALTATHDGYALTPQGEQWLAGLGMAPTPPTAKRRFAYPCLDWSQRRDHLAGQLADEMLAHFVDKGWLRRADGRALMLTPLGQQGLLPALAMVSAVLHQHEVHKLNRA